MPNECSICGGPKENPRRTWCYPCQREKQRGYTARRERYNKCRCGAQKAVESDLCRSCTRSASDVATEVSKGVDRIVARHGWGRCWLPCCAPEKRGTPRTPAERWARVVRENAARAAYYGRRRVEELTCPLD